MNDRVCVKTSLLVVLAFVGLSGCQDAEELSSLKQEVGALEQDVKTLKDDINALRSEVSLSLATDSSAKNGAGDGAKLKPAILDECAQSLGGVLRSGPGITHERLAVLQKGEPMTLIERTSAEMDGYYWFAVKTESGLNGYQWGGIICTCQDNSVGAYAKCL